jgi:DNA processing protein
VIGVSRSGGRGPRGAAASSPAATAADGDTCGRGSWTDLDLSSLDPDLEGTAWLVLAAIPGVGPVSFARCVARFGSARAALTTGSRLVGHIPRADAGTAAALRRVEHEGVPAVARELEDGVRKAGGVAVTALDARYPPSLARLDPRPPVLYVVGALDALLTTCVAVVGTRHPTGYGRASAVEIADELARAGVTVVSGLALGIDGAAHEAAIAARGRSVAVLPSPVDRVYPPSHRSLAAHLTAEGGALVSESPPGRITGKPDFARRNRIISGLAEAVVVVEAPDRSGALLTAAAALDQGRELYAVPGPIDSVASRGCNRLIADHQAELVTSPVGLLQRIGLIRGVLPVAVANLSDTEGLVLGALLKRSGSIEELITRTNLPTGPLASALTLLEVRGLVTSFGGATFHPTLAARRIGLPIRGQA